ncbi:MAG: PHP domain-containing protein [Anaerolineales bacterium]|jgi:predicted metal-dependent phosphoesterase TrpH
MKIDAHCHTDCSDGNISIEDRISLIKESGFDAATITDHDFVSSEMVERAKKAAGSMPFIPGIELTTKYKHKVVHILGYFIEPDSPLLIKHIKETQEYDRRITEKLIEASQDLGISFGLDDLVSDSLHTFYSMQFVKKLAGELFDFDSTKTMATFLNLLEKMRIPYPNFSRWSVQNAIDLIHETGGFAVLAHPGGKEDKPMQHLDFLFHNEEDIRKYVAWGLDGIETSHPVHNQGEKFYYSKIANEFGLLTTAGSDCHGDDPFLGPAVMGAFRDIPDDLYERMMAFHENMK